MQGFRFTSPLLDVELPEGVSVSDEPIPFKHKIEHVINNYIKNGRLNNAAVYYRDLLDGPWFGINEDSAFNPASMMKVPVMIAWLKRAQSDPKVLETRLTFNGAEDLSAAQNIKPARTIKPGESYTIGELLRYMLNYSDNNATSLLYNGLSGAELNDVLDGMDVDNKQSDEGNFISVHGYSGFFRILYNASYLNRDTSEMALQLLSLQDFPEGIAAGVPKGVPVAAKFGEYAPEAHKKQLHEFGIVYHPRHPYIIGIMTQGRDFATQAEVIRTISQLIYTEVERNDQKTGNR